MIHLLRQTIQNEKKKNRTDRSKNDELNSQVYAEKILISNTKTHWLI